MMAVDLSPWLVRGFAFVLGGLWGSFFNVAIHRWPLEMSVVTPPSHCPACEAQIPAWRNVPIFGWIFLRGRAACCGVKISPRYVAVETLSALLCVALAENIIVNAGPLVPFLDAFIETVVLFSFVGLLLIGTFTDLQWMIIPDEVTLTGTAIGLLTVGMRAYPSAADAAIGAGAGFLVVQMIFVWSYERLTGRRGMGEGDAKLLMMIGAFIGWKGVAFSLGAGAMQGLFATGVLFATGKLGGQNLGEPEDEEEESTGDLVGEVGESGQDSAIYAPAEPVDDFDDPEPPPRYFGHRKIKFGPFLALAALEFLFFGEVLLERYFALFAVY